MELCYSPLVTGGNLLDSDTDAAVYLAAHHVEALQSLGGTDRATYIVENVLPQAPASEKAVLHKWLTHRDFFAQCLDDVDF